MSHSNGTINGAAGTENGHCENVYYQPPMDTGQSPMIKIDVPTDVSREEPRFPKEKIKTLYCESKVDHHPCSLINFPFLSSSTCDIRIKFHPHAAVLVTSP